MNTADMTDLEMTNGLLRESSLVFIYAKDAKLEMDEDQIESGTWLLKTAIAFNLLEQSEIDKAFKLKLIKQKVEKKKVEIPELLTKKAA